MADKHEGASAGSTPNKGEDAKKLRGRPRKPLEVAPEKEAMRKFLKENNTKKSDKTEKKKPAAKRPGKMTRTTRKTGRRRSIRKKTTRPVKMRE